MEENDSKPDLHQTIVPPANNIPYIIAVVIMMALGVIAVVMITLLRPEKDNSIIIATLIGFLAPTTLSLLAFMKSQETHLSVNSRLDAFMNNARQAAHAQGITEGRTQGRDRANERTDSLAAAAAAVPSIPSSATTAVLTNIEANTAATAVSTAAMEEKITKVVKK